MVAAVVFKLNFSCGDNCWKERWCRSAVWKAEEESFQTEGHQGWHLLGGGFPQPSQNPQIGSLWEPGMWPNFFLWFVRKLRPRDLKGLPKSTLWVARSSLACFFQNFLPQGIPTPPPCFYPWLARILVCFSCCKSRQAASHGLLQEVLLSRAVVPEAVDIHSGFCLCGHTPFYSSVCVKFPLPPSNKDPGDYIQGPPHTPWDSLSSRPLTYICKFLLPKGTFISSRNWDLISLRATLQPTTLVSLRDEFWHSGRMIYAKMPNNQCMKYPFFKW